MEEDNVVRNPFDVPVSYGTPSHPSSGQEYVENVASRMTITPIEQAESLFGQASEAMEDYYRFATQAGEEQAARARELWDIYKNEYLPGELAWAKQSFAGIPVQQAVDWASADVNRSFDKALDIQGRNMSRMGINPNAPRYADMMHNYSLARAAAEAGAKNLARRDVRNTNYEMARQAAAFGKGMPTTASGITASGANIYGQGASGLGNTLMSYGNTLFGAQQDQIQRDWLTQQAEADRDAQAQSSLWGAVGDVFGSGLGALGMYYGLKR